MSYIAAVVPPAMAVALQKLIDTHNELKVEEQLKLIAALESFSASFRRVMLKEEE